MSATLDERDLRRVMRCWATGVAVVTSRDETSPRVPVLAWVACELVHELEGGDHSILIGRPLAGDTDRSASPLVFFGGRYRASALEV